MRTPYRLAGTLARFRLAQALPGTKKKLPLLRIQVPETVDQTPKATLRKAAPAAKKTLANGASSVAASKSPKTPPSPILWLTGVADSSSSGTSSSGTASSDALSCPVVGKFTRQLRDAGRTVFLETDGTLLRRRIHEFRPDARLYITVRLYGTPHTHDLRMKRDGAFALAMEGLRAAHLSGFLICAHVVVERDTQLHEINLLLQQLCIMNLDGMIITAESDASKEQRETAIAARGLIGNSAWASFSRLVQLSFDEPQSGAPAVAGAQQAAKQMQNDSKVRGAHDAAVSSEEVAVQ
jgi:hypothetical protein